MAIINGIKNQNERLNMENSKYLVLSIQFLIDILSNPNFRIEPIDA